jgi:peptide subunit release factor RF-3
MLRHIQVAAANEILAGQINAEARQNANSPYAGKLVGIANGKVVAIADTWKEVVQHLRQVEPDPAKCYCIEASADYERVEEIWRMR